MNQESKVKGNPFRVLKNTNLQEQHTHGIIRMHNPGSSKMDTTEKRRIMSENVKCDHETDKEKQRIKPFY